jgi:hypothetical protein
VYFVGILFSLVSVLEDVKTAELQVVFFLKKKIRIKNLQFWVFQKLKETADSVKEPAKNSRFLTVL